MLAAEFENHSKICSEIIESCQRENSVIFLFMKNDIMTLADGKLNEFFWKEGIKVAFNEKLYLSLAELMAIQLVS